MLISFTCLSVVFFAKLSQASVELPPDGLFAVEIGLKDGKIVYHHQMRLDAVVEAEREVSISPHGPSWTLSFDGERFITLTRNIEGGLKITAQGLKILYCDGTQLTGACVLRSSLSGPLPSPYYGYVKTQDILKGAAGPLKHKTAPIRYFFLYDLHLFRSAVGVTPSDESDAVYALHRAINQTMENATEGWLSLTPEKSHSNEDAAIRALAKSAAEISTLTTFMDAYSENSRQLQSELGAENLKKKRALRGDDDLIAIEALSAAESRMEALGRKLSHSDREYEQARQQLQTARVAYESASSSLQSLFSDTLSAIFAARFWAQLAVLRKAKYAVLVVADDKVEVKFGGDGLLSIGEVEFSRESSSGHINVVGPYTDQLKLEDGSTNLILKLPRTSRSSPYYPRRDGILSALPFGGWVELRHVAPLAPSATSFLVFTLGDDRRILETAIRHVLGSIGANRAILSKVSHASYQTNVNLPLFNDKAFYRSLRQSRSNIMVVTLTNGESRRFQLLDIENPSEKNDEGPIWGLKSPSGKNWQLQLQKDPIFHGKLLNGLLGSPLEKRLPMFAQDELNYLKTDPKMRLPESPLLGAWRVGDQSSFYTSGVFREPTVAIHPTIAVLFVLDPERVDGDPRHVQEAIKSAFRHLPSHYRNPFSPPDMQRPIYEVYAFWYQVEMLRMERGSATMSSQSLSASASAESISDDPFFAALVVLNYQIICLKVGAPGTDIVISKEWLSEAEDLIIRYIESADKGQVRVDLTGQRAETLDAQFGKITVSDSILIYVVGGVNTEEVAVRVAAVVDMVVLGIPFDDSLMYRRLAENSSSPPQLVFIGEDGVPVYPSVHEPYRVDSPAGSLQLVRDTILVNGESIEPFTMFCRIPLTSANCVKQKNSNFPVVLYDVNGVGPIDINLTLKELDKAHKKGMS